MTGAAAIFSLSALLGVPAGAGSLLSSEQVRSLAALLLRNRPADLHGSCFLGGTLEVGRRPPDDVVRLTDGFGLAPFLVIASHEGAVALLTGAEGSQLRARLICDPELVDRAALVLAQLSDHPYRLSSLVEAEMQQAFIARLAGAMVAELTLSPDHYLTLMADEPTWPALATALTGRAGAGALLAVPELRQILQQLTAQRVLLGQLDADQQQLTALAVEGGPAPQRLMVQQGVAASVIRRGRPASAASAVASGLEGVSAWADGSALTIVPLLRDQRVWGLLIVTSPRPLASPALAALAGVGALLALNLETGQASWSGMQGEVSGRASLSPALPLPDSSAVFARGPEPLPAAPAQGAGASTVVSRTTAVFPAGQPRPTAVAAASSIAKDLGPLLAQLGDAVLLVDGQGQVAAYTTALARLLGINVDARGQPLGTSGAACLAPLLSEALMGESVTAHAVELPMGGQATASVIELAQGLWAFVLREGAGTPTVTRPPAQRSTATESERVVSFLSDFANLMRAPLRELRELIAQMPAAGALNEQQSHLIGQAVKLNSELTIMVNDLLALGQIGLEAHEHRSALRLDLLIEAAVGTQYAEFARRAQQVTTDLPSGLPRVAGSEQGLGWAIAALIDNAIKYSPTGAHILVKAAREGDEVVVMVSDDGLGLSPDEQKQIFDPFYRAASTAHLGVSGHGLGLTIARTVIEQHDGRIWVTSAPGLGSTFAFSLPAAG